MKMMPLYNIFSSEYKSYECPRVNIIDKKIAKGKSVEETCMSKIILAVGKYFMSR